MCLRLCEVTCRADIWSAIARGEPRGGVVILNGRGSGEGRRVKRGGGRDGERGANGFFDIPIPGRMVDR